MENADQFKDMSSFIKIGKKRPSPDTPAAATTTSEEPVKEGDSKRFKADEESSLQGTTEDKTSANPNEETKEKKE